MTELQKAQKIVTVGRCRVSQNPMTVVCVRSFVTARGGHAFCAGQHFFLDRRSADPAKSEKLSEKMEQERSNALAAQARAT